MKISSYVFAVLLLTGCMSGMETVAAPEAITAGPNSTAEDAQQAIAAAEAARKKAASVGHEWRDTVKFITQAQAFAEQGDYPGAVNLAKHAELEGRQGYQQGIAQKDAGPRF